MSNSRIGGLAKTDGHIDPAVADWLKDAQTNRAALTRKQKADRKRVRVKYDFDPALKVTLEAGAKRIGTSASQFAAFLMQFAVKEWQGGNTEIQQALLDGKSPSKTMRFEWNLDAPAPWRLPEN